MTRAELESMGAHVLCECASEASTVPADVFWVQFKPKGTTSHMAWAEGKIYLPHKPNHELVHMSPGFPGGNAGRMEMLHAARLVEAGYAVSAHRFNGTSFVGDDAEEVINCPERLQLAREKGETHVGGFRDEGYLITGVLWHPLAALLTIGSAFERIHTIGHSMGAAANNVSVNALAQNHPNVGGRVRTMVSLAGYVAGPPKNPDDETWPGLLVSMGQLAADELERMVEKGVNFSTDPRIYRGAMFSTAWANSGVRFSEPISQMMLFAAKDPLIRCPEEGEDIGPAGARKLIIRDERQPADDTKPHSMRWVQTEELIHHIRTGAQEGTRYLIAR